MEDTVCNLDISGSSQLGFRVRVLWSHVLNLSCDALTAQPDVELDYQFQLALELSSGHCTQRPTGLICMYI